MNYKNYKLIFYKYYKLKNGISMSIEDFTKNKYLTCGIGRSTLPFGYNLCDSSFFKYCLSNVDEINESFYRFICSQFNFIVMAEYLYKDINEKTYRSTSMGLQQRNDLTLKEKYEYFLKNEKQSEKTVQYYCNNRTEIFLSELHYYIVNGYKLTFCKLCKKPFFTKNLNNKYCERKGLDKIHPEYSCNKIRALQRNLKCSSTETKMLRKIIISTLARIGADTQYNNKKLLSFKIEESEYKKSHLPSEYEQWIKFMYKKYVPNGNKIKTPNTD